MIEEFDKVRIKSSGVIGTVVDMYTLPGRPTVYLVEDDERDETGGFPIIDCHLEDLEKIT